MADVNIVAWVEDRVISYFAERFHYPTSAFKWDTNVRRAFNFSPAAWAELADQLNRKDWMIQIHVLLAQLEMGSKSTIGDLTSLVCDKYRAERSFAAIVPAGSALSRLEISDRTTPKGKKTAKTARKKKKKAKKVGG